MLTSIKKEYEEKGVAIIPSVFTPEECDRIIAIANNQYASKARVGSEEIGRAHV